MAGIYGPKEGLLCEVTAQFIPADDLIWTIKTKKTKITDSTIYRQLFSFSPPNKRDKIPSWKNLGKKNRQRIFLQDL
jgi:hypothetical protein